MSAQGGRRSRPRTTRTSNRELARAAMPEAGAGEEDEAGAKAAATAVEVAAGAGVVGSTESGGESVVRDDAAVGGGVDDKGSGVEGPGSGAEGAGSLLLLEEERRVTEAEAARRAEIEAAEAETQAAERAAKEKGER